jgi:hypothetical protein
MDHYGKARREGLRIYTTALQAHEDPFLPVLESKVPDLSTLSRMSLGIITVPLSRVLGSVSPGRSKAFTKGFLPILEGGSEFAAKWDHLYESVESEGVNQPVTALEYMGYYYVTEGNKRVSVMKAMGARDIEADVTRVFPPRSDDPEVAAYYEYCDFTKETGLYAILFSRPGSYQKLLSLPVPPQQFFPHGHAFHPCLSVSCCLSGCSLACLSLSGKNKLCSWFLPRPFSCPLPGLPFFPCSQKNCVF